MFAKVLDSSYLRFGLEPGHEAPCDPSYKGGLVLERD